MSNKEERVEVSTTKAAFLLNISTARLRILLKEGRVKGARKVGRSWLIPLYSGLPKIAPRKRGPKGTWRKRKACAPTIISVNRHIIAYNQKFMTNLPPFRIKRGNKITYSHVVYIDKLMTLIYTPDQANKNAGGATAWFECNPDVFVKPELWSPYDPNLIKDIKAGKYKIKKSKDKSPK